MNQLRGFILKGRINLKKIHGNKAKIEPGKNVVPEYTNFPVTNFTRREKTNSGKPGGELKPEISETDVEAARDFVNRNKK